MKASWQSAHGGENSGGTAILEEGGTWEAIALKSTDAQFLELWTMAIIEIARVFRVPPSLIFELGRATWGNASEMGSAFLRFTISRWLRTWEGEISLKLIGRENADRYHVEFDTDDLLRADLAARANAYSLLIAVRALTVGTDNAGGYLAPEQFVRELDRISIDDIFDALPSLKEPMLQYVAACAGLDATERTSGGGKGNSVPFKDYLESLYRIGTGWLGWPPSVTLDATPAEISEAYKGRIEFMRAIFGSSEPEAPTTSNLGEKFKAVFSGMGTKIMQRPIRKARAAA